jgi:hypothetical protein
MVSISTKKGSKPLETAIPDPWRTLVEELAMGVQDPARFKKAYDNVSLSMRRILTASFCTRDLAEEATLSAFRTLLRRVQTKEFSLDDATAVERFLVQAAFAKAHALLLGRELPILVQPIDPRPSVLGELIGPEEQARDDRLQEVMRRFVGDLLRRMEPYLENPLHHAVFECILKSHCVGPKLTQVEIAAMLHCSESVVQRVQRKYNERWRPLVEEARREYRALVEGLEGMHV